MVEMQRDIKHIAKYIKKKEVEDEEREKQNILSGVGGMLGFGD